ncbi:MAG TPA: antirestriction protein ArdA [Dysgonomonas sp.]|uniref:antirestriction protein ArdA n=1 Tax=unclassified Dysgonomonas TaxID=2630389 RepID=UPI0025C4F694|nr:MULTISPECIES: antirestriction protein ArdA [unclassified Dysgonomonas]HML65239.1 antirestriction protein ArdA [Dysgonomonas sp.]
MGNTDLTRASVYVCRQKPADGSYPQGVRLELIHYKDMTAFKNTCKEYLRVTDKQVFYFDYENIPGVYISETWICPELFTLVRFVSGLPENEQIAFSAWLDVFRPDLGEIEPESLEDKFRYSYEGYYRTKEQFGQHYARERMSIIPDGESGFNLKAYTWMLFDGMFVFRDGYVFKNT